MIEILSYIILLFFYLPKCYHLYINRDERYGYETYVYLESIQIVRYWPRSDKDIQTSPRS